MRRLARALLSATLVAVLAYLGVVAFFFTAQRSLIYYPSPEVRAPELPGATVSRAGALAVPVLTLPAAGDAWLVWFHGNAEQLADTTWLAEAMNLRGVDFAAVEYPGYGLAREGRPSEAALLAAARVGIAAAASA
ncbi:MAG: alpha/beta hydrolase, partial [Pseudomonadota bacterium]